MMSTQRPQRIIAGVRLRSGDAPALYAALLDAVGALRLRPERELVRSLERAHGLVIEAAERVNREPDERAFRLLDVAMTRYTKRVAILCTNGRRAGR